MATGYRVCAPYVTVSVIQAGGGETVLGFYEGGTLPPNSKTESVESLLAKGMVEKAEDLPDYEEPEQAKPTNTIEVTPPKEPEKADAETDKPDAAESVFADRPPKVNASKEEWVNFAVSQREGEESEEDARAYAENRSKADLIAEYGG